MDKELETGLAKTIELLNKTIEGSGNFVMDQAPQVVKEIVTYSAISSFCWMLFWGMILFVLILCLKKTLKAVNGDLCEDVEIRGMVISFFLVLNVIIGAFFFIKLQDGLKAIFAPRVVIIDYVRNGLK